MSGINPVPVSLSAARGWKKAERVTSDVAPTKLTTLGYESRSRSLSKTEPVDDSDPDCDSDSDSDCDSPDVTAQPIRTSLSPPSFSSYSSSRTTTKSTHHHRRNSCSVCFQNEARYACPRCNIPYCSAACYRNHTTANSATNSAAGNPNPSGSCTEEFFREKVASLMKLEASEQKADAHRALNRYHHEQQQQQQQLLQTNNPRLIRDVGSGNGNGDNDDDDGDDDDGDDDDDVYNLYQLWSQLEALELEDRQTELSPAEIAKLLPPSLRNRFESDLRNGKVKADLVLDRWHPWWARELVGTCTSTTRNSDSDTNGNENGTNADSCSLDDSSAVSKHKHKRKKTLDERFLGVPSFAGLGKTTSEATAATTTTTTSNEEGNHPTATRTDEVLFFNLLDILCAICRTLRLYHGVENAVRQAPVEAAGTLIASSAVLSRDVRFASMAQVLDDHCHHHHNHHHNHHHCFRAGRNGTSSGSGNDTNNAEWLLHMQDTAALVESPRLVGRALLEASDVFKAAIKVLKSSSRGASKKATTTNTNKNKNKNTNTHTDDGVETETETKRKQFFRLRKKLEFYLSWTLRHPVASKALLGVSAGEEIRDWIEERRQFWNDYNNNRNDECTITTSSNSNSNIDNDIDNSSKRIAIIDGLDDRADDNAITTLKFPANPSQNNNGGRKYARTESTTEQLQPLMVEVQSRRKQETKTRGNSNK